MVKFIQNLGDYTNLGLAKVLPPFLKHIKRSCIVFIVSLTIQINVLSKQRFVRVTNTALSTIRAPRKAFNLDTNLLGSLSVVVTFSERTAVQLPLSSYPDH